MIAQRLKNNNVGVGWILSSFTRLLTNIHSLCPRPHEKVSQSPRKACGVEKVSC
jgi:hypothetical protein